MDMGVVTESGSGLWIKTQTIGTPLQPDTGTSPQPETGTPPQMETGTPPQPETGAVKPDIVTPLQTKTGFLKPDTATGQSAPAARQMLGGHRSAQRETGVQTCTRRLWPTVRVA